MTKKTKTIRVGDIIWMERFGELIEVLGCLPDEGQIHYWTSAKPKQRETKKCHGADAWIIFKYGEKVGTTQPTTNLWRSKL